MSPPPSVTVVGSVNIDLVAACPTLPAPGETLHAAAFTRVPGGKGANQALAARRIGAEVAMVAKVGDDENAGAALAPLRAAGVRLDHVHVGSGPTGLALITVADDARNTIVVVGGANAELRPRDLPELSSDGVICQLEIPTETVDAAAEAATGLVVLNAAPAVPLSARTFELADVVVVNEVEQAAHGRALATHAGLVVVTLGARGAVALERGEVVASAQPPVVEAVDTVGAGDAFVGAFTVWFLQGGDLGEALRAGCAAGALATTVPGAQTALPDRSLLESVMRSGRGAAPASDA